MSQDATLLGDASGVRLAGSPDASSVRLAGSPNASSVRLAGSPNDSRAPVRVGTVELRNRVLAAPICGASKLPYRLLARRYGADIAYTEMVKAIPLTRRDEKTLDYLATSAEEAPCGPQICGGDEAIMADAARALEQLGFPLVDINMGCPVPKVVREGAGAALLKEPERVERIVFACASAVKIPVTVKIRSGWDGKGVSAVPIALAAERGGAAMISIHARTREQRHNGAIDFETIAAVKQAVKIPVVGNGSVNDGRAAIHMLNETGCDAVMVGRGAFGRPWVFRDIARAIRGEPPLPPPSPAELRELVLWHLDRTLEIELSERKGNSVFRKFAAWYFRDAPFGAYFRDRVFHAQTPDETRAIVTEFTDHLVGTAEAVRNGAPPPVPHFVQELVARGIAPKQRLGEAYGEDG